MSATQVPGVTTAVVPGAAAGPGALPVAPVPKTGLRDSNNKTVIIIAIVVGVLVLAGIVALIVVFTRKKPAPGVNPDGTGRDALAGGLGTPAAPDKIPGVVAARTLGVPVADVDAFSAAAAAGAGSPAESPLQGAIPGSKPVGAVDNADVSRQTLAREFPCNVFNGEVWCQESQSCIQPWLTTCSGDAANNANPGTSLAAVTDAAMVRNRDGDHSNGIVGAAAAHSQDSRPLISADPRLLEEPIRQRAAAIAASAGVPYETAAAMAAREAQQAGVASQHFGGNLMASSDRRKSMSAADQQQAHAVAAGLITPDLDSKLQSAGLQGVGSGRRPGQGPSRVPTPDAATATSASGSSSSSPSQQQHPFITAEQAVGMVQHPAVSSTIMVGMHGCGGCEQMKAAIARLRAAGALEQRAVGILMREEWEKVRDRFPADQVPKLFKVGMGNVTEGPTGAVDDATLAAFVKA